MNCNDAIFYSRFRHPGSNELDPAVSADLDRHLTGCVTCAGVLGVETTFDAAVGRAMRAVPIPADLHSRLVARVGATRGFVPRLRHYRYPAMAATILLALGVGLSVYSEPQPFDLYGLLMTEDRRAESPETSTRNWLAENKLPALPEAFDFSLLVTCGQERIQGRDVPMVVFRERGGDGFAKVYFVRESQFDFKSLSNSQASRCTAFVHPDSPPGFKIVIVHTGPTLTPFLRGRGGVA